MASPAPANGDHAANLPSVPSLPKERDSHHKCRHHDNPHRISKRASRAAAAAKQPAAPRSTSGFIVHDILKPLGTTILISFASAFAGILASYMWGHLMNHTITPGLPTPSDKTPPTPAIPSSEAVAATSNTTQ